VAVVIASVAVVACGRSSLDDGTVFPEDDSGTIVVPDGSMPDRSSPGPDTGFSGCGPANCASGCCDGSGVCRAGDSVSQCGRGGQQCQNCVGLPNAGCDALSHTCTSSGGSCSPGNCAGCCTGTSCLGGAQINACGSGGQGCQNCAVSNGTCQLEGTGFGCSVPPPPPPCSSANCAGCCDGNGNCQAGFLDTACGQNGAGCTDCTGSGSMCDVNITPRACLNMQDQCPSNYAGCAAGLVTPGEKLGQNICSGTDLQNAGSACSAGAHTTACNSFFAFETGQNPACAQCLSTFDFDFTELKGVLECVSPFVNATCNHDIACLFDCASQACDRCPDPQATTQCQGQAINGTCSPFANDLQNDQCAQAGALGGGAFCLPVGNAANFGGWLEQVGTRFCGP
jgi:hypothetical protein